MVHHFFVTILSLYLGLIHLKQIQKTAHNINEGCSVNIHNTKELVFVNNADRDWETALLVNSVVVFVFSSCISVLGFIVIISFSSLSQTLNHSH